MAVGSLYVSPPNAYASGSQVTTPLSSGVDQSGKFAQYGNVTVFGNHRSTDNGATWSIDPLLTNHSWVYVGNGELVAYEMGRSGESPYVARVYSIVAGTLSTYALPFFPEQVNHEWAMRSGTGHRYDAYNFITGQSVQLDVPVGAAIDARAYLSPSGGLLWLYGSLGLGHYAFAPSPMAQVGPWVTLSVYNSIAVTSTRLAYTTLTGQLQACSLPLNDLASPATCAPVVPGPASIGTISLYDFGDYMIVGVTASSYPYGVTAYLWSGTSVTPIPAPQNRTLALPFSPYTGNGTVPHVVLQDASAPSRIAQVNPDGSLATAVPLPTRSAVPVTKLAIAPDRVVGTDYRNGGTGLTAWARSVSDTGFETETVISHGGDMVVASAGRTGVRSADGQLSIYDRGVLRSTVPTTGTVTLSGPYYRINTYHFDGTTTTIRRVDGEDLGEFPVRGQLFGSEYIAITMDSLPTGSYHAVITDLTGAKSPMALDLPPGTAACPIALPSLDVLALMCGTVIKIYDLRSGALVASRADPSLAMLIDLHAGYLMYASGAGYVIWDFLGDSAVAIPDPHNPVLDDAGHLAYTTETELVWRDLSSFARGAPRLLGIVAPPSVSFAAPGVRWTPELDTTKALRAGQIVISADDGTPVRSLATPASADGSIRGVAWDGRDAYGRGVPAGTYTYRLVADAVDGTGTVVSVDGTGTASGKVSVTGVVAPNVAGSFTSLSPSRILDTRLAGGRLSAGESRSIQVTGVPATGVSAVVLNVTVTDTTASGYLTVSPTGTARPTASNLNWSAGSTIPNAVTVKVGTDGKIDLYQSGPGSAQVIVDIAGYYLDGAVTDAGGFISLTPARIADTRVAGGKLAANSTRDFQVAGNGGVPATGVSSVVMNVTVTDTTATGYLTVFPTGTTKPLASNLNWSAANTTIPNLVVAKLGTDGMISVYENGPGTAALIIDVAGYYLGGTPTKPGTYVSLAPARVLDTRSTAAVAGNGDVSLGILGKGGIPASGVSGVVINTTVTETRVAGYLTVYPGTTARPLASNLNWVGPGVTIPNLVTTPVGTDGSIRFYNGSGSSLHVVADTAGYFIG